MTGAGVKDFFAKVQLAAKDYEEYYKVELQKRIDRKQKEKERRQTESMDRLKKDLDPADRVDPAKPADTAAAPANKSTTLFVRTRDRANR